MPNSRKRKIRRPSFRRQTLDEMLGHLEYPIDVVTYDQRRTYVENWQRAVMLDERSTDEVRALASMMAAKWIGELT